MAVLRILSCKRARLIMLLKKATASSSFWPKMALGRRSRRWGLDQWAGRVRAASFRMDCCSSCWCWVAKGCAECSVLERKQETTSRRSAPGEYFSMMRQNYRACLPLLARWRSRRRLWGSFDGNLERRPSVKRCLGVFSIVRV